ncbi:MAG: ABC transporter ATP-binding protein [Afipia sp.]|nr:ABC transporter ATP-binding protein [Afipia sp.]OJW65456.1 MAG: sugar ABC transporter ATP-binding protein [Afipia sp. 64-13]
MQKRASVSDDTVLTLTGITKSFGPVHANRNISLELRAGEVLALLGENGAGKSTLMSILFGQYKADSGNIKVHGAELTPGSPRAAMEAGIGMVHQHFNLADNLSVLDNIVLGTTPSWRPYLDRRSAEQKLAGLIERSGLTVDPKALVGALTVGEKQRVEILKALFLGANILILDEPTAVLTPQESEQLFQTIHELVATGMSVIFISHKLDEVVRVSDRVMVLRAGQVVFEVDTASTCPKTLAERMIGRPLPERQPVEITRGKPILSLINVSVDENGIRLLKDVSLEVGSNEIVGVVGVSGNGQLPLFEVIAGIRAPTNGVIELRGKNIAGLGPAGIVQSGVGRIPEDRLATGLIGDLPIWMNLFAEVYENEQFQRFGFIRKAAAVEYAQKIIEHYSVSCPSPQARVRLLSGGNMQKLILGRNLDRKPDLIVASQPTRGLDIGAVSFVYDRLEEAKKNGAGVLLISEDLDELLTLSDRVVVAYHGNISAPMLRRDVTVEKLGLMMMGRHEDAKQ